ncbi:TolC family protein, partial [Rhodoferax ferrireducens]|uniref:TolC family protein n=1 Tax=Rhodoferax ferrireducens TaxID=192843 RepID=UPI0013003503
PGWPNRAMVLTAGLLLATVSQAQTLGSALEQAWSRHPQAAAFSARESEAQARAEVAAGLTPGPASVSLSNLTDRLNANSGKNEWELELAVPLWLPGQRAARGLEAGSATSELAARRAALRLQIAGELREAWWALALARQALDLGERRDAAARALEADVLRRFKAGELARLDANLAQNERLAAEGELLEARSALRQAEQSYRLLTGEAAPALLNEEKQEPPQDMGATHPQLAAAQAAVRLAQARLGVAQQNRREAPELALRVVRDRGDFNAPYANMVGVKLTVPFSSGARVRQETSAAQVEAAQADAELALVQQRIELDAARARLDMDAAQQQLTRAQERRALTADTLRLNEKSFALGESDLATLLRARTAAFEAEAFFNRQQTARFAALSRLNQSLGALP